MSRPGRLAAVAGLATAAACNLAPDYRRPETPLVASYKETARDGTVWHMATPADEQPRGAWWRMFGDPVLDGLEAKADIGNESLKAAVARYDQARADADYARAQYFPILGLNGDATRQRLSQVVANPRTKPLYNDFELQGEASYEVDVWGRVHNSVEAAGDTAEASAADLAAMRLSIQAELATDYFSLRGDDAQQAILDRSVADYNRALQIVTNRLKGGAGAVSDVDQAETQLRTAEAKAADMRLKRAQLEHAIAILTGAPPERFSLAPAPLVGAPPSAALVLPGELLQRRPDVAAAERRVAAANADIGVARAAYFPSFTLDGGGGVESAMLGTLFSGPATLWSFGPSLAFTLFDAGERDADVAKARAATREAAADYRGTVLGAYREVEDGLAALTLLKGEGESQIAAADAAGRSLDQARIRFNGGIVTYLEVVSTENAALQAELDAADTATRRMDAAVSLVKALGGGWQEKDLAGI